MRRVLCVLAVAAFASALSASPSMAAEGEVPCASIGDGKYECGWWPAGNGLSGGTEVVASDGHRVGFLHRGRNWIICQQEGIQVRKEPYFNKSWAWTLADNGEWGWANAVNASGGANDGRFGGSVPDCAGAHGRPPGGQGEIGPPASVPPPAPSDGIDHSLYRAGQHLELGRSGCTAAFPVRIGRRIFGLTAGHCGKAGTSVKRIGIEASLGVVQRSLFESDHIDALVFGKGFTPGTRWAQEIERGSNPPLKVDGHLRTEQQREGLHICFAGQKSGADQCGKVKGARQLPSNPGNISVHVVCTDIGSRDGDSGGPVYTQPSQGHTRAVGILSGDRKNGEMCYQPIEEILEELGGLNRLPQVGEIR